MQSISQVDILTFYAHSAVNQDLAKIGKKPTNYRFLPPFFAFFATALPTFCFAFCLPAADLLFFLAGLDIIKLYGHH